MKTPSIDLAALGAGVVKAIAAACIIGGGTMVLDGASNNAAQDVAIQSLQRDVSKIDQLSDKLDRTNQNLERLIGREEARRE